MLMMYTVYSVFRQESEMVNVIFGKSLRLNLRQLGDCVPPLLWPLWLTFSARQATILVMTALPSETHSPPMIMHTRIAYLANDQVTRPVGVRVVEPPPDTRQALRGKLFAVVELPGDSPEQEAFAERLLSTIQRTYYTVKGTQSHVLREALREAKRSLDLASEAQPETPLRAAIIIAAVMGTRVLIVSNGLGLALVTTDDRIDVYPPYRAEAPANEATEPEGGWEIYRQDMPAGGALFISGRRWLQWLSLRDLASTVAYLTAENCADAAAGLLEQANQPALPGLLIVLTPSVAPPAKVAQPATGLAAALRRPRPSGLPTTLNATPPVHDLPSAANPATPKVEQRPVEATVQSAAMSSFPVAPSTAEPTAHSADAEPATAMKSWLSERLQQSGQQVRGLWSALFPEQGSAESAELALPTPQTPPQVFGEATATPTDEAAPTQPASPHIALPARTHGRRARLFVLLAVLILVLVPTVVAALQWQAGAGSRAEANALLDLAEARLASAQTAFDAGDQIGARSLLSEAQGHVDQARVLLVGRSARADDLSVQINRELNEVLQIQPLYGLVEPLIRFPSDAQPSRVIVVDQDIYVLDSGRQLIQHFRLDLATNTVPDQAGSVLLYQGQKVGDATVDRPIAMTWQLPIPGVVDKANLIVLDRNNQLFAFDPRVEGATRLAVADSEQWIAPTQIVAYGDRLYVLDEGANQIFRYNPINYSQAPDPWFTSATPINLKGVQTMLIDGNIWLLYTNGQILQYQQGMQVSFALESSIPLPAEPVALAAGSQNDSFLYLADRSQQRILVYDKQGLYQRQLQAAEGDPLRGLSGLFVDEVAGTMYILTQSALYQHALPN